MTETATRPAIDRRRFIRDVAIVAWAAPMILTLGAETSVAQACACPNKGATCGTHTTGDPILTNCTFTLGQHTPCLSPVTCVCRVTQSSENDCKCCNRPAPYCDNQC